MFSLLPENDTPQALRIRRFLIAAYSYLMWMALITYCHYQGFMRLSTGWIIKELAIHDDLTRAFNRRHLFEEPRRHKALADRDGYVFSIALFDLDHFKHTNDTYGHLKGDDILKHLIQAVKHEIREVDCLARYGGEEFIVIMPNTDITGAEECSQRIKKTAEKLKHPGFPESFNITISTGVTIYQPVESIEQAIARADNALYRAKSHGRNQVAAEHPA